MSEEIEFGTKVWCKGIIDQWSDASEDPVTYLGIHINTAGPMVRNEKGYVYETGNVTTENPHKKAFQDSLIPCWVCKYGKWEQRWTTEELAKECKAFCFVEAKEMLSKNEVMFNWNKDLFSLTDPADKKPEFDPGDGFEFWRYKDGRFMNSQGLYDTLRAIYNNEYLTDHLESFVLENGKGEPVEYCSILGYTEEKSEEIWAKKMQGLRKAKCLGLVMRKAD